MLRRAGYSAATAVVAAAAAAALLLLLIDLGHCSFNMNVASTMLIIVFTMALPVIIPATIGGVTGYAFGRRALIVAFAILLCAGASIGIREVIPHAITPDGASGCRIDL